MKEEVYLYGQVYRVGISQYLSERWHLKKLSDQPQISQNLILGQASQPKNVRVTHVKFLKS